MNSFLLKMLLKIRTHSGFWKEILFVEKNSSAKVGFTCQ